MATIVNDTDKRLAKLIQERDDLVRLYKGVYVDPALCDYKYRLEKINNLDKSRELLIQKNSNNFSKDSLDKINQIEKEIHINRNELEYLNFLIIKYQKRLENNNMSQKEFRENHLK